MDPAPSSPDAPAPATPSGAGPMRRGDWTLPIVLLVAAAVVGALLAAFSQTPDGTVAGPDAASLGASWIPTPRPTGETVSLTIDFGNGARRQFEALPYSQGMTLGDLMRQARSFRPPISFVQKGADAMSYLTSLDGVANQGGDGRNWMYSVNGRDGDVSFAVQPLAAGAAVLWEFRRAE